MMILTHLLSFLSLRGLVIAGFFLAILPGAVAVTFGVLALEELARLSKDTAYKVAQISEKTQILRERVVAMERKGKQYLVLQEDTVLDSYLQSHEQLQETVSQLAQYAEDAEFHSQLDAIKHLSDSLVGEVMAIAPVSAEPETPQHRRKATQGGNAGRSSDGRTDELFDRMTLLGGEIGRLSTHSIDRLVANLERETTLVQSRILSRMGIFIVASLLLVVIFTYLITRPVRQLDHAIRQLGTGNLEDPISVSGPSDLRYLGQRLEWLRDQLTMLERAKQRFVRNVSHELKTPLANIHEGATLLADQIVGEMNSEQQGIVEIMLSNAQRLEHLIRELIHYGSADEIYDKAQHERVDLREVVRAVIEDHQLRLRAKAIALNQRLNPAVMSGNRDQLRLVVDNLLSNAVKYTRDEGSIEINLAEKDGYVVLEVQDDGPGISVEDRAKVFEPFYRARLASDSVVKGTGLGLAIVRECVACHQGRVEVVDPRAGRTGACFRLRLPVDPNV